MRMRYLGRLLTELTQALILKLLWKIWSWTYRTGCPSQRHRRSAAIYCPVNAEVLLEWHIPQEMAVVSQSTLCAAPGCCWIWPAPLLTLSWSLGCSALSCGKVCSRFTWPLESETGKCQFRGSHGGAIDLQVLSPGLLLALGLSVFFSSYTYTHTYIGKTMNSSSILLLPVMLCLGNYCP